MAADGKLGSTTTPPIPGTKWHVRNSDRPQPRIVTPADTFSLGAEPPSDSNERRRAIPVAGRHPVTAVAEL